MTGAWRDDGVEQGGTVGGDGAGESWSRRFTRDNGDGTWTVRTSYYYPVDIAERFGEDRVQEGFPFDIESMWESIDCTDPADPGGTETAAPGAEYEYDYPEALAFRTYEDARARCLEMAKSEPEPID